MDMPVENGVCNGWLADEAWYLVAAGIRRVVENIRNGDQSDPK